MDKGGEGCGGVNEERREIKKEKMRRKIEGKKKNRRKKRKLKKEKEGYFGHFILYTGRGSCFAKEYSKLIQLHHQIRFTSTATAEAATATAVTNAP
jgi:hypothetical protein